jgi:hypothetical protein
VLSRQRMLPTISRLRLNVRRPSFRRTLLLATPILVSALYARRPLNVTSTWSHLRGMATQSTQSVSDEITDYGNFQLLQSFPIKYAPVKVAKWRSEKTGLTVVVGDHQGGFGLGIMMLSIADSVQHLLYVCTLFVFASRSLSQTNGHFAIASESE